MLKFGYNVEKNNKLKQERDISFDEIIAIIESGGAIDVLEHLNKSDYPGQKIYIVDVDGYIWLVPFVENEGEVFLKTAFPSRKHTKQYLRESHE